MLVHTLGVVAAIFEHAGEKVGLGSEDNSESDGWTGKR